MVPWIKDGPILLALDDTLARKRGLKSYGVGMHHAPLLSTHKVALTNWGHSWVILGVIVRFPFRPDHAFCLPILFRLYISQQTIAKRGGRYRTRPELAVEILAVLCRACENRRFHVIADSADVLGGAVERTAPPAMLLYSLIVLWFAAEGHRRDRAPRRPWYRHKAGTCFADMLNTLRVESVRAHVLSHAMQSQGHEKVLKSLLLAIQQAA